MGKEKEGYKRKEEATQVSTCVPAACRAPCRMQLASCASSASQAELDGRLLDASSGVSTESLVVRGRAGSLP